MAPTTPDASLAPRIRRLALVSAVALGVLWWLALQADYAAAASAWALAAGWLLMPAVLVVTLRRSGARFALVVPSTLVTLAVLLLAVDAWRAGSATFHGWAALLAGLALGDLLGVWFWSGFVPVPRRLREANAPGRWLLIAVHVALVVAGAGWLTALHLSAR